PPGKPAQLILARQCVHIGGLEDPAHATGTEAEIEAAFTAAYRILRRRIEALFALPLAHLEHDPARLRVELDRIGTLSL
ncbi:protein tyrosine phosphatase, partial [mine drainage metagenome]